MRVEGEPAEVEDVRRSSRPVGRPDDAGMKVAPSVGRSEGSIEQCVRSEYARLVGVVSMVAGSAELAEEAVQEAFARAWERSDRGERFEHLAGWVVTVALNLARSGRRRRATEGRALDRLRARQPAGANVGTSPSHVGVEVRQALEALPRRQREAVVLHHLMDLDVATVAGLLGVSESTVKTALERGRTSLAVVLRAQMGDGRDRL